MKRLAIILIVAVTGCKEITFREPQPRGRKALSSIPKELHGRYHAQKENGEVSNDTIIVSSRGYRIGYYDPADQIKRDKLDDGKLGDSLVLKTFKGYYFLNFAENPEWLLRVFKKEKNGDLIYMIPEQEGVDFKDYISKLSKEIRIDSVTLKDEVLYQIDPSPKKLVELVEKGYFSRTLLKKINN
jgi:hypothetical protein